MDKSDARDYIFPISQLIAGCQKNPAALIALPAHQLKEMIESAQWLIKCSSRESPSVTRAKMAFHDIKKAE